MLELKSNDSKKLRNQNKVLNYKDTYFSTINDGKNVGKFIEFHPSDICNFNCSFCSYKKSNSLSGNRVIYPFDQLDKLRMLDPKAITIVGGGEPTLYYDKENRKNFGDLVQYLSEHTNAKLGLITNGSTIIKKETLDKFEWLRISLDYTNPTSYLKSKGYTLKKVLEKINNQFLKSDVSKIGIGYLINNENLEEIYDLLKYFKQTRVNIQFRKTCPIESCDCPLLQVEDKEDEVNTNDLSKYFFETMKKLEEIICKEPDLEKFVKEQTNLGDYFKKTKQPKEITAKKCYTSLFRWIVRPEGSVFPCVMCATQNNKKIGSIFEDSLKVLQEESFKFYHYEKCTTNDCCKIGQGVQNDIFEQSLDSSEIKYESNDFFI
ncbi:radical SAM protein [Enterococcus termitis]|uniref:Radical SAM core domain-containing protein n=1 Tax=Enterococcus termitis TaxID=332950 RepID=A0A1E5GVJ9_9ENTE|nr:radical SAM protein [Enterococcus termitis]OEG16744.1 hypothetical protein BCR25_03865 [Enterococcus termitis]